PCVHLVAGGRGRKSATLVRWLSASAATVALPTANFAGSMATDSILSPLPVKSRPIALNGEDTMLTMAFFTTVQMALLTSADQLLSVPVTGSLTRIALSA